jgi:hypothetical protein
MAAFLPGSSGAFDPHLPNTIMAQGEDIGEPPFMAATMHPPTLFKRTRASYPSAGEELTMKLGLSIGCSGARLDVPVALVQRAQERGYDSAGRPKPMAPTRSRCSRSSPPTNHIKLWRRHRAAGRANAGQRRHVGRLH